MSHFGGSEILSLMVKLNKIIVFLILLFVVQQYLIWINSSKNQVQQLLNELIGVNGNK